VGTIARGILAAVRARPKTLVAVAAGVLALDVLLPPLVLSLARKPWDYATFNPWLHRFPEYLASSQVPLAKKLEFLPNLALFWISADSPYGGTEWGFAVTVGDLTRFVVIALLFGFYAALVLSWRDRLTWRGPLASRGGRVAMGAGLSPATRGGVFGALTSVFGFSTGGCTVMGCGAPVLPVIGLAFVGLSSGTLALLALVSRVATSVVLVSMTVAVLILGWRVGRVIDANGRGQAPGAVRNRF